MLLSWRSVVMATGERRARLYDANLVSRVTMVTKARRCHGDRGVLDVAIGRSRIHVCCHGYRGAFSREIPSNLSLLVTAKVK